MKSKPKKPPKWATDKNSDRYIDPEKYGCKPGFITWQYLNALYEATFERSSEDKMKIETANGHGPDNT